MLGSEDAESMPAEGKRQSALEMKPVTRKTLEVYAASVREFFDWSGLLADGNVEALEVDRLFTEFTNIVFFRRATGLEETRNSWSGDVQDW